MGYWVQGVLVGALVLVAYETDRELCALGRACYALVLLDVGVVAATLVKGSSEYAATLGAAQWSLYSVTVVLKLGLFYFLVSPVLGGARTDHAARLKDDVWFTYAMYGACLPYVLWMIRANHQLFGTTDFVLTLETFVYTDIISHVAIDLVDAVVAFFTLFGELGLDTWLLVINGIVVGLIWFLHLYSFPSTTIMTSANQLRHTTTNAADPPIHQILTGTDVLLTRKWVVLVSLFAADLPLLTLRVYIWICYPLSPGMQGFLLKNLVSIPLSVFRFAQCRRTEHEVAALHEGVSPVQTGDAASGDYFTVLHMPASAVEPGFTSTFPELSPLHRLSGTSLVAGEPVSTPAALKPPAVIFKEATTEHSMDESTEQEDPAPHNLLDQPASKLLDHIEQPRTIPIQGFGLYAVLHKLKHCWRSGNFGSYRSRMITMGPVRLNQRYRLELMLLVKVVADVVAILLMIFPRAPPSLFEGWTNGYMTATAPSRVYVAVGNDRRQAAWMGAYAASVGLAMALLSARMSSVQSMLFAAWAQMIGCCAWWCVLRAIVCGSLLVSHRVPTEYGFEKVRLYRCLLKHNHRWAVIFIAALPLIRLVRYARLAVLYYRTRHRHEKVLAASVPSPSQRTTPLATIPSITNPVASKSSPEKYIRDDFIHLSALADTDMSNILREFADETVNVEYETIYEKQEHGGFIRYSSALFVLVVKHLYCPVSFHARLVNPDILKSMRLCEHLFVHQWGHFGLSLLLTSLALALLRDLPTFVVWAAANLTQVFYITFCQAERLVALRAAECQALFMDIVAEHQTLSDDDLASAITHKHRLAEALTTHSQVEEFIVCSDRAAAFRREGLFSSPGDLVPFTV